MDANLASPAMKQRQTILTSWPSVVFVTIIIIIFFSIIIVIIVEIVLVTLAKNACVKSWRDLFKDIRKVTQMTLYATHQLVKSETNGWRSHLAPNLLTAAPKTAMKLSLKTAGVLLP